MSYKITRERLKQIVEEEHDKLLREFAETSVDHKGISTIVNGASALLAAFEKFEKKASPQMMSSLGAPLNKLKQTLHDMVKNPSSYVMQPKKVRKVVSLAPVKDSDKKTF